MAFEVFTKGSAPVSSVPTVTIQKSGTFSISAAAHAAVDSPDAFLFLFDKIANLVALQPSELSNLNAYPARDVGKSKVAGRAMGPVLVAGAMFLRHIGRESAQSMRYVPEVRDGMLIIDMSSGAPVIGNRSQNRRVRLPTTSGD